MLILHVTHARSFEEESVQEEDSQPQSTAAVPRALPPQASNKTDEASPQRMASQTPASSMQEFSQYPSQDLHVNEGRDGESSKAAPAQDRPPPVKLGLPLPNVPGLSLQQQQQQPDAITHSRSRSGGGSLVSKDGQAGSAPGGGQSSQASQGQQQQQSGAAYDDDDDHLFDSDLDDIPLIMDYHKTFEAVPSQKPLLPPRPEAPLPSFLQLQTAGHSSSSSASAPPATATTGGPPPASTRPAFSLGLSAMQPTLDADSGPPATLRDTPPVPSIPAATGAAGAAAAGVGMQAAMPMLSFSRLLVTDESGGAAMLSSRHRSGAAPPPQLPALGASGPTMPTLKGIPAGPADGPHTVGPAGRPCLALPLQSITAAAAPGLGQGQGEGLGSYRLKPLTKHVAGASTPRLHMRAGEAAGGQGQGVSPVAPLFMPQGLQGTASFTPWITGGDGHAPVTTNAGPCTSVSLLCPAFVVPHSALHDMPGLAAGAAPAEAAPGGPPGMHGAMLQQQVASSLGVPAALLQCYVMQPVAWEQLPPGADAHMAVVVNGSSEYGARVSWDVQVLSYTLSLQVCVCAQLPSRKVSPNLSRCL